jgi:hypothetical protein
VIVVFLTLCHYIQVQKIPEDKISINRVTNLLLVLAFLHYCQMLIKRFEDQKFKTRNRPYELVIVYVGLAVPPLLFNSVYLYLSCWLSGETPLKYSKNHHVFILILQLYTFFSGLTTFFPILRNFINLVNVSLFIPLLTSLFIFDEVSMYPFLTLLPAVMALHSHDLIRGVTKFKIYKERKYENFITLIGRHDSLFLYIVFGFFMFTYNFIDTLSSAYELAFNLWFVLFALYLVNCAMDEKTIQTS